MNVKEAPLFDTYARANVVFVSGKGCELFDQDGKRYLDFLGGIAVVSAGHANGDVADAIAAQAKKLCHVSNLFWSEPMAELAVKLRASAGGWGRVFFCNSGAEANECAIKLTRKWAGAGRYKIICTDGGFHGRTLATLAATGQPPKWVGFEPLPEGFVHVPFNDLAAFAGAIDDQTAGILVEPIQGEFGVIPAAPAFLQGLRELCSARNLALIFDEVQTGMGRTGSWWAFQSYGVKPDIFTSAKGLANGLPIGACIAADNFAEVFKPGDHGSTFGGGAVASRAACATLDYLSAHNCLANALERGEQLRQLLVKLPLVQEVRGMGLMRAAVLKVPKARECVASAISEGLVINAVSDTVLRFLPPLSISAGEIFEGASILESVLKKL